MSKKKIDKLAEVDARNYSGDVIPKFYTANNSFDNKLSSASKYLLVENDRLLKKQHDEVSLVFSETKQDRRQAAIDAKASMRDFDNEQKIERRLEAVAVGTCDPNYTGSSKSLCDGFGCFRCSGQIEDAGPEGRERSRFDSRSSQIEEQRLCDLADKAARVTL